MPKSADAFRTISEVSEALNTPQHVLRFWETKFPQIKPVKRAGGRRYYRPADLALLAGIRTLLHDQGLTIRGVQKILRESGVRPVMALGEGTAPPPIALPGEALPDEVPADEVLADVPTASPSPADAPVAEESPAPMAQDETPPDLAADLQTPEARPPAAVTPLIRPAAAAPSLFPHDPDDSALVIEEAPMQIDAPTLPALEGATIHALPVRKTRAAAPRADHARTETAASEPVLPGLDLPVAPPAATRPALSDKAMRLVAQLRALPRAAPHPRAAELAALRHRLSDLRARTAQSQA